MVVTTVPKLTKITSSKIILLFSIFSFFILLFNSTCLLKQNLFYSSSSHPKRFRNVFFEWGNKTIPCSSTTRLFSTKQRYFFSKCNNVSRDIINKSHTILSIEKKKQPRVNLNYSQSKELFFFLTDCITSRPYPYQLARCQYSRAQTTISKGREISCDTRIHLLSPGFTFCFDYNGLLNSAFSGSNILYPITLFHLKYFVTDWLFFK